MPSYGERLQDLQVQPLSFPVLEKEEITQEQELLETRYDSQKETLSKSREIHEGFNSPSYSSVAACLLKIKSVKDTGVLGH